MKIIDGVVRLEAPMSISPPGPCVIRYRDMDGTEVAVSMKTLIRLYELAKFDMERKGIEWTKYTDSLFRDDEVA